MRFWESWKPSLRDHVGESTWAPVDKASASQIWSPSDLVYQTKPRTACTHQLSSCAYVSANLPTSYLAFQTSSFAQIHVRHATTYDTKMSPINWSASPVEMEAAYKTYMGRRNAEVELFKNQPKPTLSELERANLVISSADEECIFIIYHTAKDAQAAEKKHESFSELKALWRDFRLARAARREFRGRHGANEPRKPSKFITFRDRNIPWLAKGSAISWKLVRTPE
ncbi:hypothetical protein PG993_009823 [Apiospora rasikravindrae]|uniref:Uncharacterized protein n=1 Tax=Apiospora rasikravindrae TaxID=990691 RepID=A0ABR1SKH1_9PEZI